MCSSHLLFLSSLLTLSLTANGLFHQRAYVPPLEVEKTDFDGTVLIIGAGSAGMFAAYTFEYLGFKNYTILEAYSDVGGRVREMSSFIDVPLDLGAEWIHNKPRVLQDLLLFDDTVNVETIAYRPRKYKYFFKGKLIWMNFLRLFYKEWKFKSTTWYSYLKNYVYRYISHNVVLNTVVRTVDYSNPNYVSVIAQDGTEFRADKVIIATPVTILQQDDITFTPALPADKQSAIDDVFMAAGVKVWIEFDEQFYPDIVLMDIYTSKFYMNGVFRKPTSRHVLILYTEEEPAAELAPLDDNAIFAKVMAELDDIFDGKASAHYKQHYVQNWLAQPYIKGAFSMGNRIRRKVISNPINERVYFCGEYLNWDYQATVHGAAITGRSVADRLLLDAA